MGRMFGIDGIRGIANLDITCPMAYSICLAVTHHLSKLAGIMTKLPQVLYNVKTTEASKAKIPTDTELLAILEDTEKVLGERSRVLLRPSGTEPLYRVMLEGENFEIIVQLRQKIFSYLKKTILNKKIGHRFSVPD